MKIDHSLSRYVFIGECNKYKFNTVFGVGVCTALPYERGNMCNDTELGIENFPASVIIRPRQVNLPPPGSNQ